TAWFIESLLTELVVALVVRTRRVFFRSRPGRVLAWSTVAMVGLAFALPYWPFAANLGFVPLPSVVVASLVVITILYVVAVEIVKLWFYRAGPRRLARQGEIKTMDMPSAGRRATSLRSR
ncbi:MAG TPA: cation transporting ATPase C-terminal domain-containing protein, partial [Vicinamibacteria bacterium]|nr:cation transporting ATPase C-terminal domain-containing protein [Vicinamibacteria bacterium]